MAERLVAGTVGLAWAPWVRESVVALPHRMTRADESWFGHALHQQSTSLGSARFPQGLNQGMLHAEGHVVVKLLEPSKNHKGAFLLMAHEWTAHGNGRYRLAVEDFDAYLAKVLQFTDRAQVPDGWVPGTEFWLDDGTGEIVACVRLRFWLTPSLETEGGHIGYDVRPSARCRGFGTAALRLVLPEARIRGLERVRVTVDSDNLPSIKIVERNGGVLSGEAISERTGKLIRQYWINTSG